MNQSDIVKALILEGKNLPLEEAPFTDWRNRAISYLTDQWGEDHIFTRGFVEFTPDDRHPASRGQGTMLLYDVLVEMGEYDAENIPQLG